MDRFDQFVELRRDQTPGTKTALLFISFISAFSLSCTRNSDSSTVRFEMPDWQKTVKNHGKVGASSNLTIKRLPARIMINISGPGIEKTLVQIWNTHTGETPPPSFEFTVPRGSKRLIQVLALTRDFYFNSNGDFVTEGAESFFYGDTTKDLSNPSETVEIALTEMSLGERGLGEGVITGRYFDQNGNGPTGKVHMFFKPPSAPPMIVAQGEIHGGWFQFFRLDGVNFFYVLEDGQRLFEDLTIENPGFTWNSSRALFTYPSGWRDINGDSQNGRKPAPQQHLIVGFFGPGAGNKKVCVPGPEIDTSLDIYTDETGDTRIEWVGKSETLSSGQAGVTHGGENANQCESGTWLEDWLHPSLDDLGRTHEAMGFMGAFQQLTDNIREKSEEGRYFLRATYVDTEAKKIELKWRYLPGVTGQGRIKGVEVFSRVLPAGLSSGDRRDYEDGDGILCGELTNANRVSRPFKFEKAIPYSTDSLEQTTEIAGIELEDWEAGKVQFVLCPYNDKNEYYSSGIVYDSSWYSGGAAPQPPISAAELKIIGQSQVLNGLCHQVEVKLYDEDNNVIDLPSGPGIQVDIVRSNTGVMLFDESDTGCTGTGESLKTIHMSGGGPAIGSFRVKADASTSSFTLNATNLSSNVQVGSISGYEATVKELHFTAKTNNGSAITTGGCYPVQFIIDPVIPKEASLQLNSISGTALDAFDIYLSYSECMSGNALSLPALLLIPASSQQAQNTYYFKVKDPVVGGTNFKFEFESHAYPASGDPIKLETTSLNVSCWTEGCESPLSN